MYGVCFERTKFQSVVFYRTLWGQKEILYENLIVTMVTIMTEGSLGGTFWHMKQNVLKSPPYETLNLVLKLTENNRDSLKKQFWQGEIKTLS